MAFVSLGQHEQMCGAKEQVPHEGGNYKEGKPSDIINVALRGIEMKPCANSENPWRTNL